MAALGATHMRTSHVLFNWSLTVWTLMSSHLIGPAFVHLFLSFLTAQAFMPGNLTLEAHVFLTFVTSQLCSFCILAFNNCFTVWLRTELLELWSANFKVEFKLLILLEHVLGEHLFNKLWGNLILAFHIGTLYRVDLPNTDLVFKVVFEAISAKVVATWKIHYAFYINITVTHIAEESLCISIYELNIKLLRLFNFVSISYL